MKKFFIIIAFCCSLFTLCIGQYSVLYNFGHNGNGDWPEGGLTLSGGVLYGMTYYGGVNSLGNIFSIDTNGTGFKDLFDFNGANGANPLGNLTISGGKLYGTTEFGGIDGIGNIFSIDTNGNSYKDLVDFRSMYNYPEGGGSLTLLGGVLYGTASAGGVYDAGYIYSIDTSGGGYRDLFDFNITNGEDPLDLTLFGNKFYAVTGYGGTHKCGVIFSVDTNGSNYKVLLNFDTINGSYPSDNLTLLGGKLYGMADKGGSHDNGCIFSIDTNGSVYNNLFDFNGVDGKYPAKSSLTLLGSMLYGTTVNGGANDVGVIFSIDTNGSSFTDLFNDFDSINGEAPSGVINSGNVLYGMAQGGGVYNGGVIYKFKEDGLGINRLNIKNGSITVYPNPNNGVFTLSLSHAELVSASQTIEIYNMLGEKIYNATLKQVQGDNPIDLTGQPNDIYLYRVVAASGELIGEGKIIVQR